MQSRQAVLLLNRRGQTLIQAVVALGLMSVISLGFATVMNQQNKELKALQENLAVLDLEKSLIAATSSGQVCQYVLNSPSPRTFNATNVFAGRPEEINLGSSPIPASVVGGTPGPTLVQAGVPIANQNSRVHVKAVKFVINSGAGANFTGHWQVEFDNTRTVRSLKPLKVSGSLVADTTNPAAATVSLCMDSRPPNCASGQVLTGGVCRSISDLVPQQQPQAPPMGTIPFRYALYGSIANTSGKEDGTAFYSRLSSLQIAVSVGGLTGKAVNQSGPRLMDTAGASYYGVDGGCAPGSCNVIFNMPESRTPARVYIYWQGPETD